MKELNEKDHAAVIASFYQALIPQGETGRLVFLKAAQLYGEGRGRRMALRAMRDGYPLDYISYFAYGEWQSTPGFYKMEMKAQKGLVKESVKQCPWACVFADLGLRDCGAEYCHEIDAAIARGFNPYLDFTLLQTQHYNGSCEFRYRGEEVTESLFEECRRRVPEPEKVQMPLSYHCAHAFFTFSQVVKAVYGIDRSSDVLRKVRSSLIELIGEDGMEAIEAYRAVNYSKLPN